MGSSGSDIQLAGHANRTYRVRPALSEAANFDLTHKTLCPLRGPEASKSKLKLLCAKVCNTEATTVPLGTRLLKPKPVLHNLILLSLGGVVLQLLSHVSGSRSSVQEKNLSGFARADGLLGQISKCIIGSYFIDTDCHKKCIHKKYHQKDRSHSCAFESVLADTALMSM